MKLILPKTFFEITAIDLPLFFLMGPDSGGGRWRDRFCPELARHLSDFIAVLPCRHWSSADSLYPHYWYGKEVNCRQTVWERHYLDITLKLSRCHKACLVAWLPEEDKKFPREGKGPYARETYGELGRFVKAASLTGGKIIIGGEEKFPGLSQIQENARLDFGLSEFPIFTTLEETAAAAAQWVKV